MKDEKKRIRIYMLEKFLRLAAQLAARVLKRRNKGKRRHLCQSLTGGFYAKPPKGNLLTWNVQRLYLFGCLSEL
jgi:hypothetical protein